MGSCCHDRDDLRNARTRISRRKTSEGPRRISALISTGTAICGGSAIAAAAPGIEAEPEQISISLGTVFVLNAIALFLFPIHRSSALDLTQHQFGIWSAIAIHDTSSVVGAACRVRNRGSRNRYDREARTRLVDRAGRADASCFIYRRAQSEGESEDRDPVVHRLFFLLAVLARSYAPLWVQPSVFDALVNLAKAGMTVTLFLIGTSLSRDDHRTSRCAPAVPGHHSLDRNCLVVSLARALVV